ncbi:OB-fold nucleic acid binding domain containing protein [Reticulomyxa filosa]|uniref:OB-fold nucleic acid binding domain containing protein n=1 Tax=Reticulomyxa filosa TaxID=46433 RepID=X6LT73_RETFI|nr:OB-fold nucleic acid binding domain containing protein [Reticulomyxa filosa]|eukprot:ETO04307.1 OB-fold nucleic acid binding domain containing protein [Reticulomyxa filosa]
MTKRKENKKKVLEVREKLNRRNLDGSVLRVNEATIGDETGIITMSVRCYVSVNVFIFLVTEISENLYPKKKCSRTYAFFSPPKKITDLTSIVVFVSKISMYMQNCMYIRIYLSPLVDEIKPGETYVFRNAKVEMYRNFMRLAVDRWGLIELSNQKIESVDQKKNLSQIEYELVRPDRENKRNNERMGYPRANNRNQYHEEEGRVGLPLVVAWYWVFCFSFLLLNLFQVLCLQNKKQHNLNY